MLSVVLQGMLVGIALAAPIGPINIEIIWRGLIGGFRYGWLVGLGALTADTIYCALVVTGAAPFVAKPQFQIPLFFLGAAVLLYLGTMGMRAVFDETPEMVSTSGGGRSYATGFIMAISNPLGIIYWLSIGAALIADAINRSGPTAGPSVVFGVFFGIFCWVTVLSGLTQFGRRWVTPRVLRVISAIGAVMLLGFGAFFVVQGIRSLMAYTGAG